MKLGSLFDGSGGFPLAGAMHGITPVWASEVEPYPIKVTKARFPGMKHLGSVLDVNGASIINLRGPEPDPDTGLVPCGWCGPERIGWFSWNRAMGWREGNEN